MSIGDARRCASRLGGIAGDGDLDEIEMVRETDWKTGFYANREPNKQEIGFIFAWSCSELWSLLRYSRVKNQKPTAVDVLFKAYPMVQCRSNLAGLYLQKLECFLWKFIKKAKLSLRINKQKSLLAHEKCPMQATFNSFIYLSAYQFASKLNSSM